MTTLPTSDSENDLPPGAPPPPAAGGTAPHLAAIERWALVLSVALVGTMLLWAGPRMQLGACVGAGLSVLNARLLRFIGARLSARLAAAQRGPAGSLGLLVALFQLKLGMLAALIYLALKLLPIQPLALLLGLSVLPVAIVVRGVQFGLAAPASKLTSPISDSYREN